MEKFARQAINDGVTSTEELTVNRDCELYRALNMHYNKANDFEVSSVDFSACACVVIKRRLCDARCLTIFLRYYENSNMKVLVKDKL